jgi:hypothetical protein
MLFLVVLTVGGLLTPVLATTPDNDVTWIGLLPGISIESRDTTQSGVYVISGSLAIASGRIKDGFTKRGWTIQKGTTMAGGLLRTLVASKGDRQVKVVLNEAMGMQNVTMSASKLVVTVTETVSAPEAVGSSAVARATDSGAPSARIYLVDDKMSGTYHCGGTYVALNGSDCDITLDGLCSTLVINGDRNKVKIKASIPSISFTGTGNAVTWSGTGNPSQPVVTDEGKENQIQRLDSE